MFPHSAVYRFASFHCLALSNNDSILTGFFILEFRFSFGFLADFPLLILVEYLYVVLNRSNRFNQLQWYGSQQGLRAPDIFRKTIRNRPPENDIIQENNHEEHKEEHEFNRLNRFDR